MVKEGGERMSLGFKSVEGGKGLLYVKQTCFVGGTHLTNQLLCNKSWCVFCSFLLSGMTLVTLSIATHPSCFYQLVFN